MVTITICCRHCGSERVVRNGHAPHGKQICRCRACTRHSRDHSTPHAYPEDRRQEILRAYQERSSLRGLHRTFGVSRNTVVGWMKKRLTPPPLGETLVPAESREVLELDELWSCVARKSQQVWMWMALSRRTRKARGLCHRGSEQTDRSASLASHS